MFGILFANFVVAQGDYSLSKEVPLGLSAYLSYDKKSFVSTFGDYNKDGFIDLFISGRGKTILFYNKDGEFIKDTVSSFTNLSRPSAQFLDYDNDKDLDLFVTGDTAYHSTLAAKLYKNDSPHYSFTELKGSNFSFLGLQIAATSILDYNNDGFMDIFVTGTTDIRDIKIINDFTKAHSILYKNNGGTGFTVADDTTFAKTLSSNVTGVDYNNDGRTDIIIQGIDTAWTTQEPAGYIVIHVRGKTYFYKNNGTGFSEDTVNSKRIVGVTSGHTNFGDYDNDGDLDMFTSGCLNETNFSCTKAVSKLYKNDSSLFSEVNASGKFVFDSVYLGQNFFRDYDSDGFLDIFSFGTTTDPNDTYGFYSQMKLYKNNSGTGFSEVTSSYLSPRTFNRKKYFGLYGVDVNFADYNNNGTVDIIVSGNGYFTSLYIYNQDTISSGSRVNATGTVLSKNTVPTPPTNTRVSFTQKKSKNVASFSWDAARDRETSQNVLSYNMYVGTKTNRDSIKVSSSFTENTNGTRKVSGIGLIQGTAYTLDMPNLANGRYCWGVQAIDGALAGGKYSQGGGFIVNNGTFKGLNPQTITFSIPPQKTITERYFTMNATANTSMPVRFTSSNSLIASISGNTVTLNSVGEVYISALVNAPNGSNDMTYIETTEKVAKMNVIKATQTISFADINPKYIPIENKFVLNASASSGLEVSYVASNTLVSINKNSVTINGIGTVNITATQSGNNYYEAASVTRPLVISKSNQTITFASIPTLTIGSTYILQATASSGLGVNFASSNTTLVSINGNTITAVATGTVIITANQVGNAEFNPANAQQTVTVINQTVTINQTGTTTPKPAPTPTDTPTLTFVEIPNNSIRIFPNPANDYITISYDKTQKVSSAKVYDMTGKSYELKMSHDVLGMKADIKNLPKGEYILVIYGEMGEVLKTERVIKKL